MYEKEYYHSLKGHVLFSLFLLILDIIFIFMALQMIAGTKEFIGINFFVYALGFLLCTVFLFFFGKKVMKKEPAVIITDKGITINGYAPQIGLIPWTEVKGYVEYSNKGQQLLGLILHNEEQFLNTIPTVKKNMLMAHKTKGNPVINIPINRLKDKKGFFAALEHQRVTMYSTPNGEETRAN